MSTSRPSTNTEDLVMDFLVLFKLPQVEVVVYDCLFFKLIIIRLKR